MEVDLRLSVQLLGLLVHAGFEMLIAQIPERHDCLWSEEDRGSWWAWSDYKSNGRLGRLRT